MSKKKICCNGHSFGKQFCLDFCPLCKEKLEYHYDIDVYLNRLKKYLTYKEINGRTLKNKVSDSLPRIPWFSKIRNEENQDRKYER